MPAPEEVLGSGIHTITMERYQSDPAPEPSLSAGIAKLLLNQSPAHAVLQHPRLNPDYREKESERFDIGSAAHSLLLEGNGNMVVVDAKDWRTNAAKEQRDEARRNGLFPILAHQEKGIRAMVDAAKVFIAESELSDLWGTGIPEQAVIWQESTGIWCRTRPDWLNTDMGMILDYKTTVNAEPNSFGRLIVAMDYHVQAAFYRRGIEVLMGSPPVFVFLAQEIEPPYACSLIGLSESMLSLGVRRVDRAMMIWAECVKTGNWAGYPNRICYAEPPTWAIAKEEEEFLNGIEQ